MAYRAALRLRKHSRREESDGKRTARQTDQGPEAARPMLLEDPEKENHEG
jgi:hypothetical protein